NSVFYCDTNVLAAKLYTNKRHLYYDDMIKNYLSTARVRFLKENQAKKIPSASSTTTVSSSSDSSSSSSSSSSSLSLDSEKFVPESTPTTTTTNQILCVNPNCSSAASATTNYLCSPCFEEQKQALIRNNYLKREDEAKSDTKPDLKPVDNRI